MTQPSTPNPAPASKPKDQPLLTIILAVLLHVLLAIVVYFTVFDHKKMPETQALTPKAEPVLIKPMITEDTPATFDDTDVSTAEVTISAIKPTSSETIPSDNNSATQNRKQQELNPSMSMIETSGASVSNNSPTTAIDEGPANSNQQSPYEYRLQQTQEHQALEDDIDKDSEQLSKLINEVKKRNQTQIQQHQTPKTTPRNDDAPILKPDYPITPIVPSSSQADENRVPAAQAPMPSD